MKIIQTDNFDRDNVSEQLIAESVPPYWAKKIVALLNGKYSGSETSFFCAAKPDGYQLYTWEP